jgi:hypothetical protein
MVGAKQIARTARCSESVTSHPKIDMPEISLSSLSIAADAGRCGNVDGLIVRVNNRCPLGAHN